eukprot:TRINITY_DN109619_c0_g1_i1.p1 TRINITY_DN109619_c0_g1~~TRINITY_DN109619_c0_g1_i1.p1  ORF type:complete len:475 (-),score=41.67 TRINITY_DN109619_c0_g1_i1:119-1543(-)
MAHTGSASLFACAFIVYLPCNLASRTASNDARRTSWSSCDGYCRSLGLGSGVVKGTAPFCDASCVECSGSCKVVTTKSGMSDYGSGCWSGDKVCCCDRVGPPPTQRADQDSLTIMNFNTFLLEVNAIITVSSKSNLEDRAERIPFWFSSLADEEVPDVLVLNEIMSTGAERMLKNMCSQSWQKNNNDGDNAKFIPCAASSKFAFATLAANPTSAASAQKCSGVVVLVKKGHEIVAAHDTKFKECSGGDCWADKGFWIVQLKKGTQTYWIVGTHTNAYEGTDKVKIRLSQFKHMRSRAEEIAGLGARVVFAGDMNILTDPYVDEKGNRVFENETEGMLGALGASGAPASAGTWAPKGFWLPLDSPLRATADPTWNHFIHHDFSESRLGAQIFDWIITPGRGESLSSPAKATVQVVPMKADSCFKSEEAKGIYTDDLSDHFAVFAHLCYDADACPSLPQVVGHRGYRNRLPSGPDC